MTTEQWQQFARNIRDRADAVTNSKHERGWALAKTVGIGRCGCSLHNASIGTIGIGWCAGPNGKQVRSVARKAKSIIDDYSISHLADRIIEREYKKITWLNR